MTGGSYAADPASYRDAADYRGDQPDVTDESVGNLLGRVTSDLSTLMRQEVELAKVEIKEEATKAGRAAACWSARVRSATWCWSSWRWR